MRNVYNVWRRLPVFLQDLTLPSPLRRREWAEEKRIEEPEPRALVFCDRCTAAIGHHLTQEECWIYPRVRAADVIFYVICGSCADHYNLDFRYRVTTPAVTRQCDKGTMLELIVAKRKEIAHGLCYPGPKSKARRARRPQVYGESAGRA